MDKTQVTKNYKIFSVLHIFFIRGCTLQKNKLLLLNEFLVLKTKGTHEKE